MKASEEQSMHIRGGLGRTLFLTFLLLALGPLSVVSFISFQNATESLQHETTEALRAAMEYKLELIKKYFNEVDIGINLQAELSANVSMMKSLNAAFKKNNISLPDFITTTDWEIINAESGNALRAYQLAHAYQDIYLVDMDGNVLYTASEQHVGDNIFAEGYELRNLLAAYRTTLETGRSALSDYGPHGHEQKKISHFVARALEDDDTGAEIGVLLFELPYTQLDSYMQSHFGLGESGETYLVGADSLLRSTLRSLDNSTLLQTRIETVLLRRWLEEHEKWHRLLDQAPGSGFPGPRTIKKSIYPNYQGVPVVGMYSSLDFLKKWGLHWVLVAEVNEKEAFFSASSLKYIVISLVVTTGVFVLLLSWMITTRLVSPLRQLTLWSEQVADGDLSLLEIAAPSNEIGQLNKSFRKTVMSLQQTAEENNRYDWLQTGQLELDDQLRGDQSLSELSKRIINYLAAYLEAQIGALYIYDKDVLHLQASYACNFGEGLAEQIFPGEGIVGQAALEKKTIFISQVPENYIQVSSALGGRKPDHIVVFPFIYNDKVKAVLELGTFGQLAELQVSFLENVGEKLAIAINGAQARTQLQDALVITTQQTDVLQSQQDELKAANEELEEQAQRLRASEEELQANQDQLMATNEQLEEKNRSLNRQKEKIELANEELKLSRIEIEQKAEEVAKASKYKSEFLANMSHELRTPLNSLLLLAQTLEENRKGNLTADDIESVRIIRKSGKDLLYLINDILDLSKIESGQMILMQDDIVLADLLTELQSTFLHLAEEKGLNLQFNLAKDVPGTIRSDGKRVDQILKNLLSNALKFTEQGTVSVAVSLCSVPLGHPETISIAVQDSGIGIPLEKQKIIFEAFQQADGSTARKYGGTGLGLSISRELASLLGGEICMESNEGVGTTFTLYLPTNMVLMPEQSVPGKRCACPEMQTLSQAPKLAEQSEKVPGGQETKISDDRDNIQEKDRVVLLIEDDARFAALLVRQCREKGLKCLATPNGEEGLMLAERYLPIAIILDLQLPDLSGWEVLESLKNRVETRHIPVHIISAAEVGERALRNKGAVDALQKPVCQEQLELALLNIQKNSQQHIRKLLVADPDAEQRKAVIALIGNHDVQSEEAASGLEISASLKTHRYDCLVMGLDFSDLPVLALLHQLKKDKVFLPPIIIYTDRRLSREENAEIRQYASSVIIKGAMSEERLLDEASLFLHRMVSALPETKQRMIRNLHEDDAIFQGKRILLVDDDMRNIFALAKVLRDRGMETVKAEDGSRALEMLEQEEFDLVLMDIMMPVMDGYETIKRIRAQSQYVDLPIIALTAKAMQDDRSRCLAVGANDYLAKPVDTGRLLALLRLWLYS
ncbi:MAG: response regulator [Candidatus Electrothrix aestuarii]|uniref:histidine kinase n=1 Tax=Candidatus Electrothrix aestuarii TaxID=3062594 RepID=A0AAU8LXZ6_9BACT|nr:response regulator [Candidatus Electrothrix aestuarii]